MGSKLVLPFLQQFTWVNYIHICLYTAYVKRKNKYIYTIKKKNVREIPCVCYLKHCWLDYSWKVYKEYCYFYVKLIVVDEWELLEKLKHTAWISKTDHNLSRLKSWSIVRYLSLEKRSNRSLRPQWRPLFRGQNRSQWREGQVRCNQ